MSAILYRLQVDGGARPTVRVSGEIDASNATEFETDLATAIGDGSATVVLNELDFIDSAGIAALDRIAHANGVVYVVADDSVVRRGLEIFGAKDLPIVDSVPAD